MDMQSGPAMWLTVLTIGVVVLAAALVFGIMRNRQRTPTERAVSEAATKAEYAVEDKDRR